MNKAPAPSSDENLFNDISIPISDFPSNKSQIKDTLSAFLLENLNVDPLVAEEWIDKGPFPIGQYGKKSPQSVPIQGIQDEEQLPHLLGVLIDLQESMDAVHDRQQKNWLVWIVNKCGDLNIECHSYVLSRIKGREDQKRAENMEDKKKRARERAMQAMKSSATSFAAHLVDSEENQFATTIEEDPDIEEEEVVGPICIVCQSEGDRKRKRIPHRDRKGQEMGYLAFSQLSSMHSYDNCRNGVARMFLDTDLNVNDCVEKKENDLHLSFCGHAMHFNCFDAYYDSVMQKSELQMGMMLDTDKGQFDCPLCKRLNNFLVPVPDISHLPTDGFRKRIKTEMKVDNICTDNERIHPSSSSKSLSISSVGLIDSSEHAERVCKPIDQDSCQEFHAQDISMTAASDMNNSGRDPDPDIGMGGPDMYICINTCIYKYI
jgi:hypothetical protein